MKKMYKSLALKIMILTSIFFICTFMIKSYKYVYAAPLSSEEIMQKEIDDLKKENKELGEKYLELSREFYKIIGSVVGLSLVFGVSIAHIIKKSNKMVQKQIAKEIGEETKRVKSMIDDLKKDENLMQYTKILVISQNEEDENQVEDLLKQFKEIKFDKLTNVLDNLEDLAKFDVIFFNDINGYIQQENMTKIIDSNINDKAVYFYFNKGKKQLQYKGNENINFAKSNATLCGNLLDLMRYQEDILKNKN